MDVVLFPPRSGVVYEEYTPEQQEALKREVYSYLTEDPADSDVCPIEIDSVRKMMEILRQVRLHAVRWCRVQLSSCLWMCSFNAPNDTQPSVVDSTALCCCRVKHALLACAMPTRLVALETLTTMVGWGWDACSVDGLTIHVSVAFIATWRV